MEDLTPTQAKRTTSFFTSPFVSVSAIVLLALTAFALGATWMAIFAKKLPNLPANVGAANNTQPTDSGGVKAIENLPLAAKEAGVDTKDYATCVDEGRFADRVQSDMDSGISLGINGTPGGFMVDLQTGNAIQLRGALPFSSLKQQIEALLSGDTTQFTPYQGELPEIRDGDHYRGSENPRIVIFEYSDYQCPYCKQFHPTLSQIVTEFDNVGWVYRHFPLESIHPLARPAAEASECVYSLGGDDAFWTFSDYLFAD